MRNLVRISSLLISMVMAQPAFAASSDDKEVLTALNILKE